MISQEIHLGYRPIGLPTLDNFALVKAKLEPLHNGQVLVHNLYMSVDPYMRGRMDNGQSYVPPQFLKHRW